MTRPTPTRPSSTRCLGTKVPELNTEGLEPLKLVTVTPNRAGYTFQGYFTGTNGTGRQCTDAQGYLVTDLDTTDAIWYAKWTRLGFNRINLDPNADRNITGISNTPTAYVWHWQNRGFLANENNPLPVGNGKKLVNAVPMSSGYRFLGYYDSTDGDATQMVDASGNITTAGYGTQITGETTWYGRWEIITYTVDYNLDGGYRTSEWTDASNPSTYTVESQLFSLRPPEKQNYNFAGWIERGGSSTASLSMSVPQGSTGNKTFIATWKTTPVDSTITYDFNVPESNIDVLYNPASWDGNKPTDSFTNTEPEIIQVPKLAREGYTFKQWRVVDDYDNCVNINANGTATINVTEKSRSSIVLQAVWTPNKVTVSWSGNNGTFVSDGAATHSVQVDYSEETKLGQVGIPTADEVSRQGYTLGGWNSNSAGTGLAIRDITQLPSAANTTYYAAWDPNDITITLDCTGGSVDIDDYVVNGTVSGNTLTGKCGTPIAVNTRLPEPKLAGYNFRGWYTGAQTGSLQEYWPTNYPTVNTVYYARWEAAPAFIKFESNGGSAVPDFRGVTDRRIGDPGTVKLPNIEDGTAPTRDGYSFVGWYSNDNLIEGLTEYYPEYFPPETTWYYAKWQGDPAYINWNLLWDDATDEVKTAAAQWRAFTGDYTGPNYTPARDVPYIDTAEGEPRPGYRFDGWYLGTTEEGVNGTYNTTTGVFTGSPVTTPPERYAAGTIDFYAKWTQLPSYINFVVNTVDDATTTPTMTAKNVTYDDNAKVYVMQGVTDQAIPTADRPAKENYAPTMDGYTFDGWYTQDGRSDNNNDGNVDDADWGEYVGNLPEQFPVGSVAYYAKWAPDASSYTFYYNYKDETQTPPIDLGTEFGKVIGVMDQHMSSVTGMPDDRSISGYFANTKGTDPYRLGWTFLGWYNNANGYGDPVTNFTERFEAGEHAFFAKWQANPAWIVFDTITGTDYAEPDYTVNNDNYSWNDATHSWTLVNPNAPTRVETLRGSTNQLISNRTLPVATMTGYTLEGWYTMPQGEGEKLTMADPRFPAVTPENQKPGYEQRQFIDWTTGQYVVPDAGVTVYYANWVANDAQIVLKSNWPAKGDIAVNGKTDLTTSEVLQNAEVYGNEAVRDEYFGSGNLNKELPNWTNAGRNGYIFIGWFDSVDKVDAAKKTVSDLLESGSGVEDAVRAATGDAVYNLPERFDPIAGDKTYLHAAWLGQETTITFDAGTPSAAYVNGGNDKFPLGTFAADSYAADDMNADRTEYYVRGVVDEATDASAWPSVNPTRPGYTFNGWYTGFDGEVVHGYRQHGYRA